MCSKAIIDQDASSLVSMFFGFRIKYTLKLLEANLRVSISRFRVCILLSRGRKRSLVTSIGARWLDNHRV